MTSAQSLDSVRLSAKADLDTAIENLAELRETIKQDKIPLARRISELEAQLREKRREVERAQRLRDNATVDLNRLRDNVKARQEQIDYMTNLVGEYGRSFKVRIDLSENQLYSSQFEAFEEAANAVDLSKPERLEKQIAIIGTAIERMRQQVGGARFPGRAVTPEGFFEEGQFVHLGPSRFFASEQSPVAGLSLNTGSVEPSIQPIGLPFDEQIRELAQTGSGLAPLDATLGNALAIKREEQTIVEHIQAGGIWIYPILFFAFLATVVSLFKLIEIYSVSMPPAGTLHKVLSLLNEGKDAEALAFAKSIKGPTGKMLEDAVVHADESKELVEEVMYERMLEVQPRLERLLPFIAVTAATAPLMGLLGTVTGMINTFKLITIFGTGDAKSLSSGISEALVTTEFGLIVAIPSLIMHALLSRRAQGVLASMERLAVAFVNGLNRKN
jgi:biopolymer transport protein ExbB